MPRIPLYNQGQGPTTRLATGQLSRRADVSAFTAPAQASAQFARSAGKVATDLAMAERDREDRSIIKAEVLAAREYYADKRIKDQNNSINAAEKDFEDHKESYDAIIDAKGYDKRRLRLVQENISPVFFQESLRAREKAWDRGTQLATDTDNSSLDLAIETQKIANPESPDYLISQKLVGDIFSNARAENRTLKYSPESFQTTLAIETFNTKIAAATTPAQVDAAYEEISSKTSVPSGKIVAAKKARDTAKTKIGEQMYATALETIVEGDYNADELQKISDGYDAGENFTIVRETGETVYFAVADMPIGKRLSIAQKSENLRGEFNNEVRAGIVSDIADAYEKAGSEGVIAVASEAVRTSEDKEQADEALLGAARNFEAQSQIAYSRGDFKSASAYANAAESILTESFSGRPSLTNNAGTIGTSANTILKSLANTRGDILDDQQEQAKLAEGVTLMEQGTYDNYGGVFLPSEERKILNMVMSGKSLPQQLEILEQNNLTFEPMKTTVNGAATEGQGATPDFEEVSEGLELYRQLKLRGKAVLANNSDEDARAFFDSVLALEESGKSTTDAITKVNRSFNMGIDRDAKFSLVKAEVDRVLDPTVTTIFGWEIMGQSVNNRSYVHEKISNLAKVYIGLGQEPSDAVRLAGENVNASHMNLRGNYILRSVSYPKDLETMADLAAIDYSTKNPDIDEGDVSIIPTPGRADEYMVTVGGVIEPFVYDMEDLLGLKQKAQKDGTLEILSKAAKKAARREAIISGKSGTIQSRIRQAQEEQLAEIAGIGQD